MMLLRPLAVCSVGRVLAAAQFSMMTHPSLMTIDRLVEDILKPRSIVTSCRVCGVHPLSLQRETILPESDSYHCYPV